MTASGPEGFRHVEPAARREGSACGSERKRYFVTFYESIRTKDAKKKNIGI